MRETSKPAGKCTPYRRSMWPPESGRALRAALVGGAEDLPGTNRSKIASSLSSPGFRDAHIRAKTPVDTVMVRIGTPKYLSILLYNSKLEDENETPRIGSNWMVNWVRAEVALCVPELL